LSQKCTMNIFKRTNENIKMGEHIYYLQKKIKILTWKGNDLETSKVHSILFFL